MTSNRFTRRTLVACALAAGALGALGTAQAQTKLKWAHVYEVSEPYHKWSVWAGDEIKKRTNGRYEVQVFPASSLGKESDINQGLTLGTVDIILTGASFAARSHPPLAVSYFPFIFRDADHHAEVRQERRLQGAHQGLRREDRQPRHGAHLLRCAPGHLGGGAADRQARGHEGPEDPRSRRAGLHGVPQGARRQRDADRLRRGLPRAAERHRRRPGEPAADDRGEEVLRGAEEHLAHRPHRRRAADGRLRPDLEQALRRRQEDLHRGDGRSRRQGGPRDRRLRGRAWSTSSRRRATTSSSSTRTRSARRC